MLPLLVYYTDYGVSLSRLAILIGKIENLFASRVENKMTSH